MNIDEICDLLSKNQNYNFVGLAVTIQHANGIDACIKQFRSKGIVLKGIILIMSHQQTGRRLSKESFTYCDKGIEFFDFEDSYQRVCQPTAILGRIIAYNSTRKNNRLRKIYVATTEINYKWICIIEENVENSQVVYIDMDDGGGSYSNKFKYYLQNELYNSQSRLNILPVAKSLFKSVYLSLLYSRLVKRNRLIDNHLFSLYRGYYVSNEEIAKYYKEVYANMGYAIEESVINRFSGAVIINTQCLTENKMINHEEDIIIYREFVDKIIQAGIKVIIKTHPREISIEKYATFQCDVYMDSSYSQESIIAVTKVRPICIISIFSSTLLNLHGIFGIPSISLAKIMLRQCPDNSIISKQLSDYIKQYEKILVFPESIDEAIEIIMELTDRYQKEYKG